MNFQMKFNSGKVLISEKVITKSYQFPGKQKLFPVTTDDIQRKIHNLKKQLIFY